MVKLKTMFKLRIYICTGLRYSRKFFFRQNSDICYMKGYVFNLPRNDYSVNPFRAIHYSVAVKNKFVLKPKHPEDNRGALSLSHLKQLLQEYNSVAEQIEVFNSYVELSEKDISNRQAACEELGNIFKSYFPDSFLHLLGSSVTGFGLKGCDVDLSFQFHPDECNKNTSEGPVVLSTDIEFGKVPVSVIPSLPPKQQLRFLRKVLKDSNLGGSLPTIIPGHHPILNFTHHNLNCDLSINNKSALNGTNLMFLCGKLDRRVAPLFRILSYWGKHSKLTGGPLKFKSYALFLLMVYFLQTRNPPILPSVQKMFDKTEFEKNQENWFYDVSMHLGQFEESQNCESIEELLQEFFLFYANFDFSTVICPIISDQMETNIFHNPEDSEDDKFELNSISIQDPLNLNWNVTTGVSWKNCKLFIKELLSANATYQESCQNASSAKKWDLLSLFDSRHSVDLLQKRKNIKIEVPLVLTADNQPELQKQHLINAANNVFRIFEYCLNFQCKSMDINEKNLISTHEKQLNDIETEKYLQTRESENNSQQDSSPLVISRFMCFTSDTWFGRSNFQSLSFNENVIHFLENEHNISLKLYANKDGKDTDHKNFHFICECHGVQDQDDVKLLVNLEAVNSDVFNPRLEIFLKHFITKCMDKMSSIT